MVLLLSHDVPYCVKLLTNLLTCCQEIMSRVVSWFQSNSDRIDCLVLSNTKYRIHHDEPWVFDKLGRSALLFSSYHQSSRPPDGMVSKKAIIKCY